VRWIAVFFVCLFVCLMDGLGWLVGWVGGSVIKLRRMNYGSFPDEGIGGCAFGVCIGGR